MIVRHSLGQALFCLFMVAIVSVGMSGCRKEGCTDPLSSNYDPDAKKDDGSCIYPAPTFVLHVHNVVGSEAFSTTTTYHDAAGRHFKFTKAHVYLSGIALANSSGHVHASEYAQIIAPEDEYDLGEIASGSYTGVNFNIGVDSAANHSDPTTYAAGHALAATSATFDHWSWNSGYVFVKIEGIADTTASMTGAVNGPFEIHIGGDSYLRSISLPKTFDIPTSGAYEFGVKIDWAKALDGVDLRHATTHTMDNMPLAQQVLANLVTAISVE
jgi:hypothetical protein